MIKTVQIALLFLASFLLIKDLFAEETSISKRNSEEAKLLASQGAKHYTQKEFAIAEKKYQQALLLDPHNSDYLNQLASVEVHLNNFQEAERLLHASLQQKLENPFAWLLLGTTYLQEQKTDEAFAALIQATLYDPKSARAQQYLGIAAQRKEWSDVAEASLRKAIELDPNYADANFNLAVFYLQKNPPALELGRRHYQRALELGSSHDPKIDEILKENK